MMAEAEQGWQPADRGRRYPDQVKRALRYRDGLMIALLAHHPLRLDNLVGLRLDRELRRDGDSWWLEIEPTDSKNRRAYLVPLAQDLTARARTLPRALAAATRRARPSQRHRRRCGSPPQGSALGARHAHHRICGHTAAAFGRPVNPHLFRDALATTIAVHRPDRIGIVTPLLGHGSVTTAQRHYNRAGMTTAAEAWHDILDQLSRE